MPDIRSSVGLDLCEESAGIRYSPSPLCHVSPCALVSFAEGWEVTRLLVFIGLQYLGNLETSAIDEACRVLAWARLKKDGPEAGRDGKKTGRPALVAALVTQCSVPAPPELRSWHVLAPTDKMKKHASCWTVQLPGPPQVSPHPQPPPNLTPSLSCTEASGPLSNRRSHGGRRCRSRRRKAGRVAGGTDGATAPPTALVAAVAAVAAIGP